MSERIDWGQRGGAHDAPFSRAITLAAGTGVVIGPAPSLPTGKWAQIDTGGCLGDVFLTGDPSTNSRYSVDCAHAARLNDERALPLYAARTIPVLGPIGKLAIWNPEGAASQTIRVTCRVNRTDNAVGVYYYDSAWPITCDDADLKCDGSWLTCDATFAP